MQLTRIRALRGPNIWSRHTALEASVDLGPANMAVAEIPGFQARLGDLLPDIFSGAQWAGADLGGATAERATLAHVLERVTMALQKGARVPVSFSKTTATNEAGMFKVLVEYREEDVARAAVAPLRSASAHSAPENMSGRSSRRRVSNPGISATAMWAGPRSTVTSSAV